MSDGSPLSNADFRARIDAVIEGTDIVALVGRVVKLGRGRNPRGKCPFHGSKSDSFEVRAEPRGGRPHAHCWGCGWHGDAIKFVRDHEGVDFREALTRLEAGAGISPEHAPAVRRDKIERRAPERELVDSATYGRWLWDHARPDPDAVRPYLRGRGIAASEIVDDRLEPSIRFLGAAPIVAWPIDGAPTRMPQAPAMVALVRRRDDARGSWHPIGVHVTFLSPDASAKMDRQRADGSLYPARKMLGECRGGGVLLGRIEAGRPLYVGEGIETVLSGLALAGAEPGDAGLAALSLDNLCGMPWRTRAGALPLHDIRPDPARSPALCFAHDGRVTGLIDADMKPLRGPRGDGVPLIEQPGGPVIRRTLTTAERATIAAELFVRSWRAAGCRSVVAARPPMGMDFNDMGRAA